MTVYCLVLPCVVLRLVLHYSVVVLTVFWDSVIVLHWILGILTVLDLAARCLLLLCMMLGLALYWSVIVLAVTLDCLGLYLFIVKVPLVVPYLTAGVVWAPLRFGAPIIHGVVLSGT